MPKDRRVEIYVEPNHYEPSGYKFWMEEDYEPRKRLSFNKSKDGIPKNDYYKVEFKLINKDNAGLKFSQLADQVLWAKVVEDPSDCPKSACYLPGNFYVDPKSIKKDSITVINMDKDVETIAFALNFVSEKEKSENVNTRYVIFDPIIENRNGGSALQIHRSVAACIAVVGAAAIAFLVRRVTSRR